MKYHLPKRDEPQLRAYMRGAITLVSNTNSLTRQAAWRTGGRGEKDKGASRGVNRGSQGPLRWRASGALAAAWTAAGGGY